jgi:hypothetical protein
VVTVVVLCPLRICVVLSAHYKNNIQTSLSFPFSQVIFSKDHILAQKTEENFDF